MAVSMTHTISLMPLTQADHVRALTRLYRAVPTYRAERNLTGSPHAQAERDLAAAEATVDRTMLGILRLMDGAEGDERGSQAAELVGVIDFRRHWPEEGIVTVGLILIAEALRRQGIGRQAWALLEPWFAATARMQTARCSLEQFNHDGLRFMQSLGFALTGEAERIRRGDRVIRLLEMQKALAGRPDRGPNETARTTKP
jgi:RimJ/RimL family protein N-acetyltransferase